MVPSGFSIRKRNREGGRRCRRAHSSSFSSSFGSYSTPVRIFGEQISHALSKTETRTTTTTRTSTIGEGTRSHDCGCRLYQSDRSIGSALLRHARAWGHSSVCKKLYPCRTPFFTSARKTMIQPTVVLPSGLL